MFTKNVKRGRGRPPGRTEHGDATRKKLYKIAIKLITARGYEATTLRDIARAAGVSPGLLYRYFPSKRAVVLALYDDLSADFVGRAAATLPAGSWTARFRFALEASLATLAPHQKTLAALTPILVGDPDEGVFAPATSFSRQRVQAVFHDAVAGATDAPDAAQAAALGRLLLVTHMVVILGWLLDRSPAQRATTRLTDLLFTALPTLALGLQLAPVHSIVATLDLLTREGLFGEPAP